MKERKKFRTIDSILQITKEVVQKNDNYNEYIINENNLLYTKQLPLLIKNSRINSLILPKIKEKEIIYQSTKNSSQKEDKSESEKYYSPINSIRTIKNPSIKLPPLCPIFNSKGTLLRSVASPKGYLSRNMSSDFNSINHINLPSCIDIKRNNTKIFSNQKIKIKKLLKNKSCELKLDLNYNNLKKNSFNEPKYNNMIYDESLIFGQRKTYQEIIKNKLIELQTIYNQNFTIKKEKVYNYGFHKKKIYLTLNSLKIKLNEVKDESNINIEVFEKPSFEYTFPFSLLPLFYYKDAETFLIILIKILIWNEETQKFSLAKNDDEIIANILKNCDDFYISDNNMSFYANNMEEFETYESNISLLDLVNEKKFINQNQNNNNNNSTLSQTNKNSSSSLINSVNSLSSNPLNKTNSYERKESKEHTNYLDMKNNYFKSYDIYPKLMKNENKNISIFEYFWITPKKSFILTIETPLITVSIPSNNNVVKKYIDFDLLFYLYSKSFVMWDFYVINNLLTYKNFRILLDNLYSIPEKKNIFFYIIQPKSSKNLFTNYELTSIITRVKGKKNILKKNTNLNENNKENKDNIKEKDIKKEGVGFKIEDKNKKNIDNNDNNNIKNNINTKMSNNYLYFNSTFIQKGLLAVVTFIDKENKIYNEYTFHFNLEHLRKFQIMEIFIDKLSFFLKFLKINYEEKNISFDFESFDEFNEFNWIKDFNKYNINYLNILRQKKQELLNINKDPPKMSDEFPGKEKRTKIKVELKCPLILMKALDENGIITTETVNVDYRVEKILSKIISHNSIDLTRQLVNILKDNNFCRKIYVSRRAINKKYKTKKTKNIRRNDVTLTQLTNKSSRLSFCSLGIIPDVNEEE